ncbi:MAG: cold shock domain-containing protein [Candidatus Thermoplasmatota archaeon]|jgi:cold shock CspA family protein|nr:cold shock domain-containing protein [Candidatus Thermoplasmatota archaeon]
MKGIVNWYSDKMKKGLIEGQNGENVMVYEKDLPFLTILHPGDLVEYSIKKTDNGIKAVKIKEIIK